MYELRMILIKKTANTFLYGIHRLVFVTAETEAETNF